MSLPPMNRERWKRRLVLPVGVTHRLNPRNQGREGAGAPLWLGPTGAGATTTIDRTEERGARRRRDRGRCPRLVCVAAVGLL